MTVLSVAYPLFPVGPDSGGGSEQIVSLLDAAIVSAGHRSVVIAATGSQISGELIATPAPNGAITDATRNRAQAVHREAIVQALKQQEIHVIHFHGLDFDEYLPETSVPMLATLHLPVSWYPAAVFDLPVQMVCVSQSQLATAPKGHQLPVVTNGIDVTRYSPVEAKSNFLLVLARICQEKGIDVALRAAHRCDLEMVVAGPVHPFPDHQKYFAECVAPLLDRKRRYIGPVGLGDKTRLLAQARALINPSSAPETSSLVAMEAFSSGTPVIALRSGALPEIVQHGETGFIVDDENAMVDAVERIDSLSSAYCRRVAETRFDCRRMACEYMNLYRSLSGISDVRP